MDRERPDPELLLKKITEQETPHGQRGTLKVFFGYAAGVGKTYAMLSAAHTALQSGIDVVAGYVEPHMRPETQALLEGLEVLSTMPVSYDMVVLQEFDLDAAIARKPQLILVDEMAHTNAKGCRHVKRYQDIQELLRYGINVYTTINVQHVESLNDVVESITGVKVRERIPDSILNSADQVEFVDVEPEELLERLQKGKIYKQQQAQKALGNFFVKENLVALREIALRRTADIINKSVEKHKVLHQRSDYFTNEHVLLCLSSSPSNAKVIRTAARMTEAFHGALSALFVETSTTLRMSEENRGRLNANIKLAEQLGASIVTVEGDDVPYHVAEFAKSGGVSKIILGRSGSSGFWGFRKANFIEKLTELAPHLDIYVIPNQMGYVPTASANPAEPYTFSVLEAVKCVGIWAVSMLAGYAFYAMELSEANIIMAFMLGLVFTALSTHTLVYSAIYALCSVLAFNYLFTEPRFSFEVNDPGHLVTFAIMLMAAAIISTLAKRIKQQKILASQKAHRTSLLLETSQKLQRAKDAQEILQTTGRQLTKLLDRTVIVYPAVGGRLSDPVIIETDTPLDMPQHYITAGEFAVAEWVFQNKHQAGAGTNTLPGAKCLYMCIRGQESALAVVAVVVDKKLLDVFEKSLFGAVLGECAMALEKEIATEVNNQIFLQAKQESLRANLLRAISHDLRTPLTSISGSAHLLITDSTLLSAEKKLQLYTDMYDDSVWLTNLVENILSVTRLDDGSIGLRMEPELLTDLIHEALRHLDRRSGKYHLHVHLEDDMLMAKMDARLIMQVVINMVDNAIKYTKEGSHISIAACRKKGMVEVCVSDDGEGIPAAARDRLFDMFFTAQTASVDTRRGLGLGLSLCKSIVNAHGGTIWVAENTPTGTAFYFTLAAAELTA